MSNYISKSQFDCEICHKPRRLKIHAKCSKIKQAEFGKSSENKHPKRKPVTYTNEKELSKFLKTIGE